MATSARTTVIREGASLPGGMGQLLLACRAELLKLRKWPATWVVAAIIYYDLLFIQYLAQYATYLQAKAGATVVNVPLQWVLAAMLPGEVTRIVVTRIASFDTLLALILGALLVGSEYAWGTQKTVLTQRPSRVVVFGGQVSALLVVLVVLALGAFAAAGGASAIIAILNDKPVAWSPLWDLAEGIGASSLILSMWGIFGAFLAVLFQNPAPAIGLGLVWTIIIEGAIQVFGFTTPVLAALLNWLPGANTASLAATFWTHATTLAAPITMEGDPSQMGQGPASGDGVKFTLVLIGYLVVLVIFGALLVRKRDVA